jgi:hypothetical protein
VTVVLDAAMMAHEVLNFHPLTNTGTTTISRQGLVSFLEATGHPPRIEPVSIEPVSIEPVSAEPVSAEAAAEDAEEASSG